MISFTFKSTESNRKNWKNDRRNTNFSPKKKCISSGWKFVCLWPWRQLNCCSNWNKIETIFNCRASLLCEELILLSKKTERKTWKYSWSVISFGVSWAPLDNFQLSWKTLKRQHVKCLKIVVGKTRSRARSLSSMLAVYFKLAFLVSLSLVAFFDQQIINRTQTKLRFIYCCFSLICFACAPFKTINLDIDFYFVAVAVAIALPHSECDINERRRGKNASFETCGWAVNFGSTQLKREREKTVFSNRFFFGLISQMKEN